MRHPIYQAEITVRLFVWAVILFFAAAALVRAEVLPVKTYASSDGLLYESVRRIYQDSRGLMWFSTPIGVSRFDGYEFTNYTIEDGLTNPGITDVIEGDDGVYWFGSVATGVYRFDSRHTDANRPGKPTFAHYGINPDGADNVVLFFKNRRRQIFAATPAGLFLLDDTEAEAKFSRVGLKIPGTDENAVSVTAIAEDADGNLWIGHQLGLTRRLADGTNIHYEVQPNGAADGIRALYADAENRLWIITDRRRLAVFNAEPVDAINLSDAARRQIKFKPEGNFSGRPEKGFAYLFKPEEIPADGSFSAVRGTSDGRIWVGTNGKGLLAFHQNGFSLYTKANGLCDDRVHSLLEDNFGNLWIASYWGLMKLPRKGFVTYKTEDGLADTLVTNVFEDKTGVLYAVNQNWKINRFDGKRFVSAAPRLPETIGGWRYHQVLLDSAGEWWIGTRSGLFRFPRVEKLEDLSAAEAAAVYTRADGLPSDDIFALFEDARGDIWFSYWSDLTGKLTRRERATGSFHTYGTADGIPPDCFPSYFRQNSRGDVFIGCRTEKIIVFSNNRFISYSADDVISDRTIHDIFVDSKDRLWVGMGTDGLRRIDEPLTENPAIRKYTTADGISEIHIQYLAEDNFGKIYFVTARGMDRLDPETGEIKYFTSADGLAAAGTGKAIRDRNGALWLATARGVSRFIPEQERSFPAPPVFISRLRFAGKDFPLAPLGETEISGLTLEPDARQLQIDFYGLNLASGEALRYQYTLNGRDWSEPSAPRSLPFYLSAGDYDFQVRAVNPDDTFGPWTAKISFTILRPVWQRWWFLALTAGLIALIIYAFYRNRLRRLVELEKVRTRIATDLHDDIGSSLSQIAILSEVVRQKVGQTSANEPLNMIADTSRAMVDSMSDIVWAINPQKDHLSDLVQRMRRFAEDMLDAQENVAYRFHFDDKTPDVTLGADVRREVYLIFKECVNNLAKHAVATEAQISVRTESDCLKIEIKDNGRGFDVTAQTDGYGGNGLPNMKKRAANLGGKFEIESAENAGTSVSLEIPFKQTLAGRKIWK
jgi:ligand-binding sensor domain-containing protein/two-component sensor histidine kinase